MRAVPAYDTIGEIEKGDAVSEDRRGMASWCA